jgi:hypothetical protein
MVPVIVPSLDIVVVFWVVVVVDWPDDIGAAELLQEETAEDGGVIGFASGSVTCVCVSVFIDPSDPTEVVVMRVTMAFPLDPGSVAMETVRPTATSEGTDTFAVSGNVCSRPSEVTTTMLLPAS